MRLNDLEHMRRTDPQNMISHINNMPQQLTDAWQAAQKFDLPDWRGIERVLISGMGGSAISGELVAAYVSPLALVPIYIHRDYKIPAWARGENTLLICSSYSGNTEETLSAFQQAKGTGCKVLAICAGGQLAQQATDNNHPVWLFEYDSLSRAAIGYSFALQLALLWRLGLVPDPQSDLWTAVEAMQAQQPDLLRENPAACNPAKRMAGQLMERWITIFGAGFLGPVARRWKNQINENAKAQAAYEILPEADHNTLQGILQPEQLSGATMNIFLRATASHARNQLRDDFTRMTYMLQGQNTDFYKAKGKNQLAQMWTALHFGDYVSYYLAMAYGTDPTPVPMLADLKEKMRKIT